MKSWILPILCLVFGPGALAQSSHSILPLAPQNKSTQTINAEKSEEESDFSGVWNLRLRGRDTRDEFNQKTLSILRLDLQMEYKLMEDLALNLWPALKAVSGHAQTDSDFEANKSALMVRQASADWRALSVLSLSGGVLNQPTVHSSLLFDEWAFPGFRMSAETDPKNSFQATSFVQSTVPTSQSLSTNTRDFEPTPSFNSLGAGLAYENSVLKVRTRLNYFEFRNLPSNLAFQSGLLGNSVKTSNNLDAQFTYGYQGLESISEARINWTNGFGTRLDFVAIRNQSAPSDLNQGYSSQVSFDFRINKMILTPSYQFFRMEPDATVASFVDDRIDTNRVGYRTRMSLQYKKKFRVYVGGGERDVLFQSSAQSRERIYDLGLETLDAKF